jgi:hypothetical protein
MSSNTRRPGGLRRPPSPPAVQFKIQKVVDEVAQVAAYIDARLVFDRLDHVCGHWWSAGFDELPEALIPRPVDSNGELREPRPVYVRCRLTLYGVTREDVGEGQDPKFPAWPPAACGSNVGVFAASRPWTTPRATRPFFGTFASRLTFPIGQTWVASGRASRRIRRPRVPAWFLLSTSRVYLDIRPHRGGPTVA